MRMSEAMRKGAAMRPQCRFTLFDGGGSCAIGAAIEGAGIELASNESTAMYEIQSELCTAYPEWDPILKAIVPLDANPIVRWYCWAVVVYLNDVREWTREDIADWLEGVEDKLIAEGEYIPAPIEPGSEQEQAAEEFQKYTAAVKIKASDYTGPQALFNDHYYETVQRGYRSRR